MCVGVTNPRIDFALESRELAFSERLGAVLVQLETLNLSAISAGDNEHHRAVASLAALLHQRFAEVRSTWLRDRCFDRRTAFTFGVDSFFETSGLRAVGMCLRMVPHVNSQAAQYASVQLASLLGRTGLVGLWSTRAELAVGSQCDWCA